MGDLQRLSKDELILLIQTIETQTLERFEKELSDRRLLATFCNSCGWHYVHTHKWQKRSDGYCNYCLLENQQLPPKDDQTYRTRFEELQEKRRLNQPKFTLPQ